MLTKYINTAMNTARYEIMEDGNYYGEIPPCPGVPDVLIGLDKIRASGVYLKCGFEKTYYTPGGSV